MATVQNTAPPQAHSRPTAEVVPFSAPKPPPPRSLDLPAVIAGNVDLLKLSEALTRAGLVGRYDGARELIVIEPTVPAVVIPFPPRGAQADEDARAGMAWFNSLSRDERSHWLDVAWRRNERAAGHGSYTLQDIPSAADAWRAFQAGVTGPL